MTDTFPQHRAGKRKPTVFEIVNDCIETGQSKDAIAAKLSKFYPGTSKADFVAAYGDEAMRLMIEDSKNHTETACMEEILAVVKSICAESGNEDLDNGQALRIAAERGNEQAIVFWYSLEAAVALDPDWSVSEDGRAVHKKGATYDSPEKLVAAYQAGRIDDPRPIEDVVSKICLHAFRPHGVTPDNIDHVDDTTRQSINALCSQITNAHPRRKEIQNYFFEQGIFKEFKRQGQKLGRLLG